MTPEQHPVDEDEGLSLLDGSVAGLRVLLHLLDHASTHAVRSALRRIAAASGDSVEVIIASGGRSELKDRKTGATIGLRELLLRALSRARKS